MRTLWITIPSVVICGVLAFVGTWVWNVWSPACTASAFIKVEPPKGAWGPTVLPPTDTMDRILATQAQLVRSQTVLERAVKSPGVRNSYWFKAHQKDPTAELYEAIGVAPVPQTDLIRVSMTDFTSNDRERAQLADVVNTVANAAVDYIQELSNTGYLRENERLNTAYRKEAADLERIQAEINQGEDEVGQSDASLEIKLRDLTHELQRLELDKKESEAFRQQVEGLPPEELANLPQVRAMVEGDEALRRLHGEQTRLEILLEAQRSELGADHATVKTTEARLTNIREKVAQRRAELTDQAVAGCKDSLKIDMETKIARLLELRRMLAEAQARFSDMKKKMGEQRQLLAEAEAIQRRIERLANRQLDLRLLSEKRQALLAKPAEVPRRPSHAGWIRAAATAAGALVGLVIGLGVALLTRKRAVPG